LASFLPQNREKIGNATPETKKKSEFDLKHSTEKAHKCTRKATDFSGKTIISLDLLEASRL